MTFLTMPTNETQKKSFGSWKSPLAASLLTQKAVRLSEVQLNNNTLYWLESRPQEKGRSVLVAKSTEAKPANTANQDTNQHDVLPAPWSIRSRCHEYGGGSYLATAEQLFFVEASDQRIYHWCFNTPEVPPKPLTPDIHWRFSDICLDPTRDRLIAIREDHTVIDEGECKEERNEVVSIPLNGHGAGHPDSIAVLATGEDFYSNPRISPCNAYLSWLSWSHPQMPWDSTCISIATLNTEGLPGEVHKIDNENESLFQPQWSPNGSLYFISDKNNWWQPYCWNPTEGGQVKAVLTQSSEAVLNAEFATPQWVFGMSTFGFIDSDHLLCTYTQQGRWHLATINLASGELNTIDTSGTPDTPTASGASYCSISSIATDSNAQGAFLAASESSFESVVSFSHDPLSNSHKITEIFCSNPAQIDSGYLSTPEAIHFTSIDQRQAYGFYYPPKNADFAGLDNEKPPLIVMGHGGPTGCTEASLNLKTQFWTSRGFAVLDVNYAGSTGYGREFRDSLKPHWGVRDVEDLCAGAEYLVSIGKADPDRLIIRGSSAGGYSVLCALTYKDTFNAGCSLYGIADLEALLRDTHKFEARYFDSLIGPYPEQADLYKARSPINHIDGLNCPVIFFQGLEDSVVPPNQAEAMVEAMKAKKIPVAYVPFEGEGHGFRQASTIEHSLEAELSFYGQIFDFEPEGDITPAEIIR